MSDHDPIHHHRVVVGIDGSDECLPALAFAASDAAARDAELVAVMAGSRPLHHPLSAFVDGPASDEAVRDRTAAELAAFVAEHHTDPAVTQRVGLGTPSGVLLAEAAGAALLVVGARGRSHIAGLLLGSTSQLVATHASVPVAVVPSATGSSGVPDGPVVVGVDGSSAADEALAWAAEHAARHDLALRVVLVYDYLSQPAATEDQRGFDPGFRSEDAGGVVDAIVARVLGDDQPVEVTAEAVLGLPTQTLLEAAAGASTLVVGSRGRGGFSGLLLGSTSLGLLHRSTCPVVVHRS